MSISRIQHIRMASGVILFFYVFLHLCNHSLGLISLEAMEAGRYTAEVIWRSWPGTILLYGALLTHFALSFFSILRHRSLNLPVREWVQLLLGLSIPPLMVLHVMSTRLMASSFDLNDSYPYVLLSVFVNDKMLGTLQSVGLLVTWIHGCLGLHFWFRLRAWYESWFNVGLWLSVFVPMMALAGFITAGTEVSYLMQSSTWFANYLQYLRWPGDEVGLRVLTWIDHSRYGFLALLLSGLIVRFVYFAIRRRGASYTVTYPDGRTVRMERGASIVEASWYHKVPHASVCGGRGRCSTCRVRVLEGADNIPAPDENELQVLARVGSIGEVRLACQSHPTGPVVVAPLLPADATTRDAHRRSSMLSGTERDIAIMFVDIRGFTSFSESKLPYDVVFVLNQYFRTMGTAVEESGGYLDKFIGDGVMALFGIDTDGATGARQAIACAQAMIEGMDHLNEHLKGNLDKPLRIGVGIHRGHVIVGEMGHGSARNMTAIGDAVNTASRVESLTKEFGAQLIVSEDVARDCGWDLVDGLDTSAAPIEKATTPIRGRDQDMNIYVIRDMAAWVKSRQTKS